MMNWENGNTNARYWVLKLLIDNFGPGYKLVNTNINSSVVTAQGFVTKDGKKILLINKRNEEVEIKLPENAKGCWASCVDVSTRENPSVKEQLINSSVKLKPFSVAVILLKD